MKKFCLLIALLIVGVLALPGHVSAQGAVRIVVGDTAAPVFVKRDATFTPLCLFKKGSVLNVIDSEDDWYRVEWQDPQFGRRVGYIEKRHVSVQMAASTEVPVDLSVPESSQVQRGTEAPVDLSVPESR